MSAEKIAANQLRNIGSQQLQVLAGFDGFVDTIVCPVKSTGADGNKYFATIGELGEFLISKSGKSCSILLETKQRKLGGNAPIFSGTVARLGQSVTCIGALGNGGIDPVFDQLASCSRVMSVAEPGQSTALEFEDGKVMFAMNADIDQLDYDRLEQRIGKRQLAQSIQEADLVALLNWSELERGSSLWQGVLQKGLGSLPTDSGKKMLIDLCDISRKTEEQINELLKLLRGFALYFELLLSLNQNEAELLGAHFGLTETQPVALLEQLHRCLGIQGVVIHAIPYACGVLQGAAVLVPNNPVSKPVLSTGAGDNFNGGLAVAWGHGLSMEEMLTVANVVTGLYVATGKSPELDEVIEELENRQ